MLIESIISTMQIRLVTRTLRLLVMAWFAMALFAAVASPLLHPQAMDIVCSGSGAPRLVVKTIDGLVAADAAGLHCPLCLAADAPPNACTATPATAPLPTFQPCIHPQVSALSSGALRPPARAPPRFSEPP